MANPEQDPQAARRKAMQPKQATVTGTSRISPDLIRLSFDCPDIKGADLPFTDHYIKIFFAPEGADYSWPFDPAEIRETLPREEHPVTRTYTFRSVDTEAGTFDIDFVVHGDQGLAGPWAQSAQVGDVIGFGGPGGAWGPDADYEHFVLVGDESAAPAICAAIEALPEGARATAYIEIATDNARFDVPDHPGLELRWVVRDGATHGTMLVDAVRAGGVPDGHTAWFIHGVAEMIKETRRFLFVESNVERADVSISGYWRLGMTEDQWQSSKREFNAQIEAEEQAAQAK